MEWLILSTFIPPLISAGLITLFFLRKPVIAINLAIFSVCISVATTSILYIPLSKLGQLQISLPWLEISGFNGTFKFHLDTLSMLMMSIVSTISLIIHVFSIGYMRGDNGISRYFAGLNFFTFSMIGLVLSGNFITIFIFWELVGLSSYILIGFWYHLPSAADAAKKAILANRLGDTGFLLGILMVWGVFGTTDFDNIQSQLVHPTASFTKLGNIIALLLFCGVLGKSAQFPLHVWLPDAMEGPTPVSALIHAATMVAAGVYLLCRVYFIFAAAALVNPLPFGLVALDVIAWVGAVTALIAALIAIQQTDIKRILAYSTLSQLGYMVLGVGVSDPASGPASSMFHLITHAFFKALLFLGAGSVIISLHHKQNILEMGGLARKLPVTFITFFVGTLALCGIPPFSGFYSKEMIIHAAESNKFLFFICVIVAFLTAFYMFRLLLLTFTGSFRGHDSTKIKENPLVITLPLILLAVPSAVSGLAGIDQVLIKFFGGTTEHINLFEKLYAPFKVAAHSSWWGLCAAVAGVIVSSLLYLGRSEDLLALRLKSLSQLLVNRLYFDEIFGCIIRYSHELISRTMAWIDHWIISETIIGSICGSVGILARLIRLLQTGSVNTYLGIATLIILIILIWLLPK